MASLRLSTPEPMVALPCGSRSTISTRCPILASPAARLTVVVVLPTPPFWLATQKIFAVKCVPPRLPLRGLRCPPRGPSRLGTARRRSFRNRQLDAKTKQEHARHFFQDPADDRIGAHTLSQTMGQQHHDEA